MNIKYKGIVWLGIYVEDFDSSVKFYQETLELELLALRGRYAHFDVGNGGMLELFGEGKKHSSAKGTDKQSAMAALLVDNLAETKAKLKAKGVEFTSNEGTYENMHWATMVDPEGNCLEIKQID